MKVLFLLTFSFTLMAQTILEHTSPTCTKLKRLDAKGEVLENHPIQHQGSLSTCYANTASLMFFSKYKKDNPNSDLEQISWLSLAQENKKDQLNNLTKTNITKDLFKKGGWVSQVYQSLKGKNLCGIPAKTWSKKEFNSSLESNAYTFEQIMNKYQSLFDDKSTLSLHNENTEYISSSCFDTINNKFDKGLKENLNKARHVENFSIFWKYLKEPKVENLKKFKDYYMTHIFTSTFKNEESNSLSFISSDSFFAGPTEVLIQSELDKFIDPIKMKQFKADLYPNSVEIAEAQQKVYLKLKKELSKQFAKCIETSLQVDPFSGTISCNKENSNKVKEIVDFAKYASREGISPSFIKDVLTMKKPLRTKQDILTQFMKSAYLNCNYPVKDDWTVINMNRKNLNNRSIERNQTASSYGLDVYEALIDLDLVGSISVDMNFFKTQKSLAQDSVGTHSMAVIGSASGCNINGDKGKRCILIQNSYGQSIEAKDIKGTKYSKYPNHMIPGFKSKEAYQSQGKTKYDKNLGYGKFWLCDQKVIDKYMTGVGVIK